MPNTAAELAAALAAPAAAGHVHGAAVSAADAEDALTEAEYAGPIAHSSDLRTATAFGTSLTERVHRKSQDTPPKVSESNMLTRVPTCERAMRPRLRRGPTRRLSAMRTAGTASAAAVNSA